MRNLFYVTKQFTKKNVTTNLFINLRGGLRVLRCLFALFWSYRAQHGQLGTQLGANMLDLAPNMAHWASNMAPTWPTGRPTWPTWRPTWPTWRPTWPTWRPTWPTWLPWSCSGFFFFYFLGMVLLWWRHDPYAKKPRKTQVFSTFLFFSAGLALNKNLPKKNKNLRKM